MESDTTRMLAYTEMLNARIISQEQSTNNRQQRLQIISSVIVTLNVSFIIYLLSNNSLIEPYSFLLLEIVFFTIYIILVLFSFKPMNFQTGHSTEAYYICKHPKEEFEFCDDNCLDTCSNIFASKRLSVKLNDNNMKKRVRIEFNILVLLICTFILIVTIQLMGEVL